MKNFKNIIREILVINTTHMKCQKWETHSLIETKLIFIIQYRMVSKINICASMFKNLYSICFLFSYFFPAQKYEK